MKPEVNSAALRFLRAELKSLEHEFVNACTQTEIERSDIRIMEMSDITFVLGRLKNRVSNAVTSHITALNALHDGWATGLTPTNTYKVMYLYEGGLKEVRVKAPDIITAVHIVVGEVPEIGESITVGDIIFAEQCDEDFDRRND